MLSNHVYNLLVQMTEEHKSHWRIKDIYKKDAQGCSECLTFWEKLERDKEDHCKELEGLIKKHLS
ncbi:hypothetical protein MYX07_02870 [Patescibacteria group bacterium AH-259-L07]|nr:hypothetical protein [Patescibacteria group bacterium AH-259-L07]